MFTLIRFVTLAYIHSNEIYINVMFEIGFYGINNSNSFDLIQYKNVTETLLALLTP